MAWIEVNNCVIRYEFRRGKGPVFVLMHEMGGTLDSWTDMLTHFPESAQVLLYDQRGSGLSEKIVEEVSIEQHIQDLVGLLDMLGIVDPVILSGVAVGAGIAIGFAARYPHLVSHLIAFAPACGIASEKREDSKHFASEISSKGIRSKGEAIFDLAFPKILQTDIQKYRNYRCAWFSSDSRSLGAVYKMLATLDLSEELSKLSCFVVFVGGEFDVLRPSSEIERLGNLCPKAEIVIAPSGHFMHVHSPKYVANMLVHLVDSRESAKKISDGFLKIDGNRIGSVGHAA